MKQSYFFFLLFWFSSFSFLQSQTNLVPNPSFEIYDTCPNTESQIIRAVNWYAAKQTPDYFNSCAPNIYPSFSVPNNIFGYCPAASGSAYCGIITRWALDNYYHAEFTGCQLQAPLQTGVKYYLSLKTMRSGGANRYNECGINKIGMLFSTNQYSCTPTTPICNCAQFYTDSIITDTLSWTRIAGSFVADSNYSFINIGNFFIDGLEDSIMVRGVQCNAYYFFDDVCVSTDSVYAYTYSYNTNIGVNILNDKLVKIYPNPVKDFLIVEDKENNITQINLYTDTGELIKTYIENLKEINRLDFTNLTSGIYNITIYMKDLNVVHQSIIKP
jgi:hypothetical protein